MNRIFYVLLITSIFSFISCQKDEAEIPEVLEETVYFTLTVEQSFLETYLDQWIIITNEEGELLSHLHMTEEGVYNFTEHKNQLSDKLGIYLLGVNSKDNSFEMNGYLNIDQADGWYLNYDQGDYKQEVGIVEIKISNYPKVIIGTNVITISNSHGFAYKEALRIDNDIWDGIIDTITFTASIVKENDTIIIGNTCLDNDPRYLKLEGVNSHEKYEFDFFDDFTPYENIITYEVPSNSTGSIFSYTIGHKSNTKIDNSIRLTGGISRFTQFGYIDGFDSYKTILSIWDINEYSKISFSKMGGMANTKEFNIPDNNFTILNSTLGNFDYSFSGGFDYLNSQWTMIKENSYSNFIVHESTNSSCRHLQSIPKEITDIYSFIQLSDLEYKTSNFTDNIEGYSYNQFISETFKNADKSQDYKWFEFSN